MPASESNQDRSWDSCPSGLIFKTAECRLETPIEQHKRKRKTVFWSSVSVAVVLMLACYSLIEANPAPPNLDASVNCQTVRGNLAAFCNNQIRNISLEQKIGKHLIDCKACRKEYRSICGCSKKCPDRIRQAVTKPCCQLSQ